MDSTTQITKANKQSFSANKQSFSANKNKYIIAAISLVVIIIAVYFLFIFHKAPKGIKPQQSSGDVQTLADIEVAKRPYATLTPTTDGAEIIITIENMGNFDRIEYELTYNADNPTSTGDKIQRGSIGTDVNTKDQEYKKSILLGTASKGVRSPDRGVTDGKLVLHLFKEDLEFLSESPWNLIQVQTAGSLKDLAGNFQMDVPSLGKSYWSIVADTVGLPSGSKDFDEKKVVLPNYGVFAIAPDFTKSLTLTIKLSKDAKNPQLYTYTRTDSKWQKVESNYKSDTKTVNANVSNFATYVVVSQ